MAMIPDTGKRVAKNTSEDVNQRIRREMQQRVARYRNAKPEQIDRRLRELNQEWDTERTLEANAATLAFTGCVLAATVDRRWIYLPMAVTAFLFQHAVQGWCPPLPVIRRLGFRTEREIQEERSALQTLRDERQALESVAASSLGFVAVHLAVDE
jgi:hypothetical protein